MGPSGIPESTRRTRWRCRRLRRVRTITTNCPRSLPPLSADAEYDPQSNAISSAYTVALNDYMRKELKYGADQTYKPGEYEEPDFTWDLRHQAPGGPPATQQGGGTNVMPDLAYTMKSN